MKVKVQKKKYDKPSITFGKDAPINEINRMAYVRLTAKVKDISNNNIFNIHYNIGARSYDFVQYSWDKIYESYFTKGTLKVLSCVADRLIYADTVQSMAYIAKDIINSMDCKYSDIPNSWYKKIIESMLKYCDLKEFISAVHKFSYNNSDEYIRYCDMVIFIATAFVNSMGEYPTNTNKFNKPIEIKYIDDNKLIKEKDNFVIVGYFLTGDSIVGPDNCIHDTTMFIAKNDSDIINELGKIVKKNSASCHVHNNEFTIEGVYEFNTNTIDSSVNIINRIAHDKGVTCEDSDIKKFLINFARKRMIKKYLNSGYTDDVGMNVNIITYFSIFANAVGCDNIDKLLKNIYLLSINDIVDNIEYEDKNILVSIDITYISCDKPNIVCECHEKVSVYTGYIKNILTKISENAGYYGSDIIPFIIDFDIQYNKDVKQMNDNIDNISCRHIRNIIDNIYIDDYDIDKNDARNITNIIVKYLIDNKNINIESLYKIPEIYSNIIGVGIKHFYIKNLDYGVDTNDERG